MLVSLMILGILSAIAVYSYSAHQVHTTRNDFLLHSKLFHSALKTCITQASLEVELPGTGGTNCKQFQPCEKKTPCKVATGNTVDNASTTRKALKEKLGFTCPKDAKCSVHINNTDKYFCMSIETINPISGGHIQYIISVDSQNPQNYQIYANKKT